MKIPPFLAAIMFLAPFLAAPAVAPAGDTRPLAEGAPVHLRLISAVDGTLDRDRVKVGVHVRLAPGWKTYWRSPGEAGLPPNFDWSGSRNLKDVSISWPRPQYFETAGIGSWGYHDEIVFPVDVHLAKSGEPLDVRLHLLLGLCRDVCIPFEEELTLSLPARTGGETAEAALIDAFVRQVPREAGTMDAIAEAIVAKLGVGREFTLTVKGRRGFTAPDVIVEGKDGSYFEVISEHAPSPTEIRFHVAADLPSRHDQLAGQDIHVTVIDGEQAAEKKLRLE